MIKTEELWNLSSARTRNESFNILCFKVLGPMGYSIGLKIPVLKLHTAPKTISNVFAIHDFEKVIVPKDRDGELSHSKANAFPHLGGEKSELQSRFLKMKSRLLL